MKSLLIALAGVAVLATGGYAAARGLDDGTTTQETTTLATTTDEADDVSGPTTWSRTRSSTRPGARR
jgi:hypothetical protein